MYQSAESCWTILNSLKQSLMLRIENYASLTIPKLCLPEGFDQMSTDQSHDYQSIGAQGVNHLTNKVILALFAPSRPFFRVQIGKVTEGQLAEAGMQPTDIAPALAKIERDAVKELDSRGQRPKLYQLIRHLIVTGNVLMVLNKDGTMRIMGMRYWCVKRDSEGRVHTLVIQECIKFDELDEKVQAALPATYSADTKVKHYRYIIRNPHGDYEMTQWVNEHQLDSTFNGKWTEKKLPYRVLAWDLGDDADYGTGLVEEYIGDFEAVSALSEATVDGAILGTEYRWLVDPTGLTDADDLNTSNNGDALPGRENDISPTQGGNPQAIAVADQVLMRYEKRIAMAFLMMTGVTRDAERVTAEEIRRVAQELETAYGGVYSALAVNIQGPLADWLLEAVGATLAGTDLTVAIITGLDALSRNGDLENLRACLEDLGLTFQLPEALLARIKFDALAQFIGDGRGTDMRPFLYTDAEMKQRQAQAQQARVSEETQTAGGVAQAEASAQPGPTQ